MAEQTIADIKQSAQEKMGKTQESLKLELSKVRTGRAHAGILDHVMVDYYGSPTAVPQVASVSLVDSRTLGVQPYEKNMVGKIEKAIRDGDLGLNPASHGDIIRVPMPALTEERRRDLIKVVRNEAEGARVAIRNIRRDANGSLKDMLKAKTATEDEERRTQDEVQKLTDKFIGEIDKLLAEKEKDLLAV